MSGREAGIAAKRRSAKHIDRCGEPIKRDNGAAGVKRASENQGNRFIIML